MTISSHSRRSPYASSTPTMPTTIPRPASEASIATRREILSTTTPPTRAKHTAGTARAAKTYARAIGCVSICSVTIASAIVKTPSPSAETPWPDHSSAKSPTRSDSNIPTRLVGCRVTAPFSSLVKPAVATYDCPMRANDWIGALKERNYRYFFIGQTTSQIGSGMAPVAVTFAVLEHHGTATDVGLVAAAGLTPVVILLLVGGVIADRYSRRLVMLSSDVLRTLAELGLGAWILVERPPIWGFMALAAVVGAGSAFFTPAMIGLVPQVVSAGKLLQANALNNLSGSTAQVMGPAIAGVIVGVWNPGWAVVVDGLTYAVSVVSLYLISIDWVAAKTAETYLYQLKVGWTEFWARTWLWVIVVEFSVVNVLIFATLTVLGPVIALQSLGGAPAWGLVLAFEGGGSVLGGIV